ncbi:hypothetical protein, partial [Dawidia soli]
IQKQDSTNALGRRAIELSKHPKLLEGFQLNKYTTFDSMVRSTLTWSIDVEKRSAKVEIPALVRDINFFPNNRHSKFNITISLGIVPDFTFNPGTGKFEHPKWYTTMYGCTYTSSAWYSALKGSPATTLELALDQLPPQAGYSLMLGIGICFGDSLDDGYVNQINRAGAAKILGIVAGKGFERESESEDVSGGKDVADGNLPGSVAGAGAESLDDAQRGEQGADLSASAPLKEPRLSKKMREKTVMKSGPSFVYQYTVGNTNLGTPVEEVTYSYTITSVLDATWHYGRPETATMLGPTR